MQGAILYLILTAGCFCSAYNQSGEPCWNIGGNCLPSSKCIPSHMVNGFCPSRPSGIECCFPYSEPQCAGSCLRIDSKCVTGFRTGLCPTNPANVECCPKQQPVARNLTECCCRGSECVQTVKTPKLHQRYSYLPVKRQLDYFGIPCNMSTKELKSAKLKRVWGLVDLGNFQLHGVKPFLKLARKGLDLLKQTNPHLWSRIQGSSYNCRTVHGTKIWSNHAFGLALDLKIDGKYDKWRDGRTSKGLLEVFPHMTAQGIYWGGGFSKEDSMHWELSKELFDQYVREGIL